MIKKSVFEDEIIAGMERELTSNVEANNSLDKAVDYVHSAIEVFEDAGMKSQADALLNVLLKLAKNKKVKYPRQFKDHKTKGLTSEKIVANLRDHGTEFNMLDDNAASTMEELKNHKNDDDLLEADIGNDSLDVSDNLPELDLEDWEDES